MGRLKREPHSVESMTSHLLKIVRKQEVWNPVSLRSHPELIGWAGIDLPGRVGGGSWPAQQMAVLFRDCGRIDLELRDLIGGGHARLLTLVSTRRFDGLLLKVTSGSSYCGIAITEPETGPDMQSLSTSANPISDGYRLEGAKQCISRLEEASHFLVFAVVRRPAPQPLISAFLVPRSAAGFEWEQVETMGLSTVSWGRVRLRDVLVPSSCRVGGRARAYLFSFVTRAIGAP